MDQHMAQVYTVGHMPGVWTDAHQQRLGRIAEEIPRVDAYQYQHSQLLQQASPPQPLPATLPPQHQSLSQDSSDAEPRAEDSSSHPSKRQRVSHTCEVCGTSYTEKRALARHRHTDQHRSRIGLPPLKKYECSVCGTQFSRRHDRMRHENERHGGPKAGSPGDSAKSVRQASSTSSSDLPFPPHSRTPASDTDDGGLSSVPTVESSLEELQSMSASYYQGSSTPDSTVSPLSRHPHAPYTPQSMDSSALGAIPEDPLDMLFTPLQSAGSLTEETTSDGETSRHDSAVDVGGSRKASEASQTTSEYGGSVDMPTLHRARSFELPSFATTPKKTSLVSRRGMVRAIGSAADFQMLCVICGSPFEDQQEDLLSHLRNHLNELTSPHWCADCQLPFVHEDDLLRHRVSVASTGECGFSFQHSSPCTGHHPPLDDHPWAALTDRDSFQLSLKLQHWEHTQLRAYMSQIKELVAKKNGESKPDNRRNSVVSFEYLSRSRPTSVYSSAGISVRTHESAPMDRGSNGETDLSGLTRRLRQMNFARTRPAREAPSLDGGSSKNREPAQRVSAAGAALNKNLRKAVYRCDLNRAEKLLSMGADPAVMQGDDAMLTIMALWDRASAQALIVQHTIGQQCYGARCGCALSRPTESRDPDLIRALLDHGANVNDPGGLCGFPLHTAAYMGKPDVVRILLEYGARSDARGGKYGTALCCAAARADLPGNRDVVRLLVEAGAVPTYKPGPEGNAIDLAHRRRDQCSMGTIGVASLRPEAAAKLACCDEVLAILGAP